MANTSLNLMDSIENPNGRVAIRLQRNLFSKDSSDKFYGRAIRNTHTVGNVLQLVANKVPQLDIGTVYSVCDALEKVVTESLGNGNSINCLNLGVFYISCKGATDGQSGFPEITVKFSPSEVTKSAISKISISKEDYTEPVATINKIIDIDTGLSDSSLSLNGSVEILGSKLKIGGIGSGIWFAEATGPDYSINEDETDWYGVTTNLTENTSGKLLFPLPKNLTKGTYRIVLKTKCPISLKQERKEFIKTISEPIEVK